MKKIRLLTVSILLFIVNIHSTSAAIGINPSSYGVGLNSNSYGSGDGITESIGKIIMIIFGIIIFLILKKLFVGAKKTITHLVVTKYNINDEENQVITIQGRKGGLLNFILSYFKADNKVKFTVLKEEQEVKNEVYDFNGFSNTTIKSHNISHVKIGYSRNFTRLLVGIIVAFVLMFFVHIVLGLLILGVFAYLYYISKTTNLQIQTQGGAELELHFSSSVVEAQSIGIDEVKKIERIINNLLTIGKK